MKISRVPEITAAIVGLLLVTSLSAAETAAALKPGTHDGSLKFDGRERTYLLFIPSQYDGTKPLPLVMFFHGGMGTAKHAAESYGWSEKAEKENFIVVYPNGTGSVQTWNAMHGCGSAHRSNIDDVGFVKALVADLKSKLKIDDRRIYAAGHSNGAMLSHRLGAELSDVFAAVAPVAGSIGGQEDANSPEKRIPQPANPVSILIIHGKEDKNVLYEGGETKAGAERGRIDLSVADAVKFWVKANNCVETPKEKVIDDGKVIRQEYSSPAGNDVVLCTVVDGGHSWPGGGKRRRARMGGSTSNFSATDAAWEFFAKHPKKRFEERTRVD
ncbi:MAG TPA: PHB depolymerase family esterase [Planctomycetota bacterium]|nr:PHB depolymerase family esterase [Planctomycetota bacterium]